ncbi:MAG TPA: hypothetical protein VMD30_12120 [Tepidisphaeraceae bacterium]|nr:hypothetical protein [Tepidisphaeraceae bacterium]
MSRLTKSAAALAVAAALGMAAHANAAATVLTSGDVVDGWRISFPTGISLVSDGGMQLTLEKFAAFDSLEGLDITFTQVSYSASPDITIADESITNESGKSWGGFQFLLTDTLQGMGGKSSFAQSFNLNDPSENFFTTTNLTPQDVTLGGGIQPNTYTSELGYDADGGQLVIDASPAPMCEMKVLNFKEIPIVAAVPAPAAAWTGLSGLLGLGILGSVKKLKKVIA